jgi:probable rRNA maturation factor
VTVTDANGRPAGQAALARWLERAAPAGARGTVSVALVTDARMKRLNATFRGKPQATDVLSFPVEGVSGSRNSGRNLGDLAIAVGVARRQAREQGHALAVELRILALHGLLHLLGYDHESDTGTMRRLEERLRRRARLPTGLIARLPVSGRSRTPNR